MTDRDHRLHAWLDVMTITYGLWLVLPMDTFAGGAIYRGLLARAPEWAWGWAFLAPALLSRIICRRGRCSTTLMLGGWAWWAFFLLLSVQTNPATGGVPLFGGLAAGYLWCWWAVAGADFRHWWAARRAAR